jgi:DNA excision repair protein ERCC-6
MPLNSTAEADVEPNHPSHDKLSESNENIDDEAQNTIAGAHATTTPHAPHEVEGATSHSDAMDEATILKNLTEGVRNQEDIQRDVTTRANIALVAQEDERDQKRIERATTNRDRLLNQKQKQMRRLHMIGTTSTQKKAIKEEVEGIDEQVAGLNNDILQSQERIQLRHVENEDPNNNDGESSTGNKRMPNESQRDFLLRTGKITPFSRMQARPTEGPEGELTEILMEAEEAAQLPEVAVDQSVEPRSHQFLRKPGFEDVASDTSSPTDEDAGPSRPSKKRRVGDGSVVTSAEASDGEFSLDSARARKSPSTDSVYTPDITDGDVALGEDEEEDGEIIDIDQAINTGAKGKAKAKDEVEKVVDDGNEADYQKRLDSWVGKRSRARRMKLGDEADVDDGEEEWFKRSPDAPDHLLPNNLKLPGDIYPALYDYQKTGVQWLGELYASQVGGIVGDEMGLGKTYVYLTTD